METEIIAAVATFRAFRSHGAAPNATSTELPPNRQDRMATTPVCEGPLVLSKLATNEITYLQVNNFTRAIMPRSRIWRVSETEIVIPATSSSYWLITLKGTPRSIERFNRLIRGLCRYERFYDAKEDSAEDQEDHADSADDEDFHELRTAQSLTESQYVVDARQTISRGQMSQRLSDVTILNSSNPIKKTSHLPKSSPVELISGLDGASKPPREVHGENSSREELDDTQYCSSRTLVENSQSGSDLSTLFDASKSDLLPSPTFPEDPPSDIEASHEKTDSPNTTPRSAGNIHERRDILQPLVCELSDDTRADTTGFSPAFIPSPPTTPCLETLSENSPQSREYRKKEPLTDPHTTQQKSPSPSYATCQSTPSIVSSSLVNSPGQGIQDSQSAQVTDLSRVVSTKVTTIDANANTATRKHPSIESRFAPRFSHPLIPSSHVIRYYPALTPIGVPQHTTNNATNTTNVSASPRLALRRRELITLGPSSLHQDVTTVGGYIGMMAVKGILRKT